MAPGFHYFCINMDNPNKKIKPYRTLVGVLAFILLFEVAMLIRAIPQKTTFIWITLATIAFVCLYLTIFCLRLIKELKENSKK